MEFSDPVQIIQLIGRILFAILFLLSAVGHFAATDGMAQYAKMRGVPAAKLSVLVTGLMLLLGGLGVLLGVYIDLAFLILAAFLIPTAFVMHPFWKESDAQTKQTTQISFNKDLALGGAALILFALTSAFGDDTLAYTLTGPLLGL